MWWCKKESPCMYHSLRDGSYECANNGVRGTTTCEHAVSPADIAQQRKGEVCPECEGRTWQYDFVLGHEVICKRCNGVGKLSPVA